MVSLRFVRPAAALVLPPVAVVALAACDDASDEDPGDDPTIAATEAPSVGAGGDGFEAYPSPVIRAEGVYYPPAYNPTDLGAENRAAVDRVGPLPTINGEVGGIRVYSYEAYERKLPCDRAKVTVESAEPEELPFQLTYFPPGTIEKNKPSLSLCPDGAIVIAFRQFHVNQAGFGIWFMEGELAIDGQGLKTELVREAELHGLRGVLAEPYTEAGYGPSMAAWPSGNGLIVVGADGLPTDELMKIVDGVTCADCSVRN